MLIAHVTPFDPAFQSALQAQQAALALKVGAAQAQVMAPAGVYNALLVQSSLLSYVDAFRWMALVSFVSIFVALCLKRVSAKGAVAVH